MAEDKQAAESASTKHVGIENLKVLENIDVELTVEVGRTEITIKDLLRLNEGSVVELDRLAGDPLDRRAFWNSLRRNCRPRKADGKYLELLSFSNI